MKKEFGVFVLSVFLLSFVVAVELMVVGEPGSFSGAILKIKTAGSSGDYGDKIYPSENYGDAGVLKFDIETSLVEGDLWIVFTKNGELVKEFEEGPFDFRNGSVEIDLRKVIVVETVSEVVDEVVVENESVVENVTEEVVSIGITGRVVTGLGNFKYYSVGGFLLLGVVLFFFLVRSAYKSGAEAELKALGKMELDKRLDELDD